MNEPINRGEYQGQFPENGQPQISLTSYPQSNTPQPNYVAVTHTPQKPHG